MKFKHFLIGMLAVAAAAISCTPEKEPVKPALEVSPLALAVGEAADEATFTITTNQDWTAVSDKDWATLDLTSGAASKDAYTVKVTVAENPDEAERSASITVTAGELTKTVTVTQAAKVILEDGSEAKPWLIKTTADLEAMREKASLENPTWFRLENDIDMASVKNWIPVNCDAEFARQIHFDGNNKTISNFAPETMEMLDLDELPFDAPYPSFFGVLYGSCKNLTITNAVIKDAESSAGILAGYVGTTDKPATVTNVSVQGTVSATINRVGGFAGCAVSSVFTDCSADVKVTTTSTDAAGFIGCVSGTCSFTGCEVKVELVSKAIEKCRCGGFIGWNRATETTIEDCHVLEGSTITDESGRTEAKISNFGGFIGFGDSDAESTKLTVKNSTAKIDVNSGDWAQVNSTFIGSFGYAPEVLLENCSAEGNVIAGENPQNYAGGLIARAQMSGIAENPAVGKLTVKGCTFNGNVKGRAGVGGLIGAIDNGEAVITDSHATGTVTNLQNNIGGIVGLTSKTVTSLKIDGCSFDGTISGVAYVGGITGGLGQRAPSVEITRCFVKGAVNASGNYAGGIVGAAQANQKIANCYCSADVTGAGKQIGGLVGTATDPIVLSNCFANGKVTAGTVPGGIIGRVGCEGSEVTKCIAWNETLTANSKSLGGAIIGSLEKSGNYSSCYRRSDMTLANSNSDLADQDDITTVSAAQAYHGKAAAAGATISSVAKSLGWDEAIWDLSKDVPSLK
jgi:hypothetical protein